jgi:hypothetical protein
LQYAIEHCGSIVHVVLARAESKMQTPRQIASCAPKPNMTFEIIAFDPTAATWSAKVIFTGSSTNTTPRR